MRQVDYEDTIIWKARKDGKYSIKSAYFLAMENLVDNASLRVSRDWNIVWSLNIPQKIKNFLWRILRNVFHQEKGKRCPILCPLCNSNPEFTWHIFFSCTYAPEVWSLSRCWSTTQPIVNEVDSLTESIFSLLKYLSPA